MVSRRSRRQTRQAFRPGGFPPPEHNELARFDRSIRKYGFVELRHGNRVYKIGSAYVFRYAPDKRSGKFDFTESVKLVLGVE